MSTTEMIQLILPLVIVQIGLIVYCIFDLRKNGVKNLSKALWILIIICINMFGPIAYLMFGRGDEHVRD
jgi:hypothetical protein